VLADVHDVAPDLVARATDGSLVLVEVKSGRPSPRLTELLDLEALHAPFGVWVDELGDGPGVAVHLIAAFRHLAHLPLVPTPRRHGESRRLSTDSRSWEPAQFLRLATRELDAARDPLDRVADVFALRDTDLAKLFGVSRQRIAQWRDDGVPLAHQPKLNAIARIADVLERNLVVERIPGIVRTAAPAFGERTLLEQIERDEHDDAFRRVEESFDWARTA